MTDRRDDHAEMILESIYAAALEAPDSWFRGFVLGCISGHRAIENEKGERA